MLNTSLRILGLLIVPLAQRPEHRIVPHFCHPRQSILARCLKGDVISPESLETISGHFQTKSWIIENNTQSTGQKNASAILNPPKRKPSSTSPSIASRSWVHFRASSQIDKIRLISFCASSGIGISPVYQARKFVCNEPRNPGKPECICAAALRAKALSWRSRGQRGSSG